MIVEERARPRISEKAGTFVRRSAGRSALPAVVTLLWISALVELLLVRTFYRIGIFIPKRGAFPVVYRALTAIGSFTFNLSSILAAVAVAILAIAARRSGRTAIAWVLAAFLAGAIYEVFSRTLGVAPVVRLAFVLGVVAVVWPFLRGKAARTERAAVAAVTLAILSSSYAGLVNDSHFVAPGAPGPAGAAFAQLAGEAVAVAAAFLLFAAWVRRDGFRVLPAVAGAFPALALLVAWKANGAITGILVLWTAGMRLYLPVWLYAIAMWAFASAAIGWLPTRPWRSGALALLVAGGFLLDSTYLQTLVLLALVLLTDGDALGGLPAWGRPADPGTDRGWSVMPM